MIKFTIYGEAKAAGSKRGFYNKKAKRVIITDANPNSRPWKALVSDAAAKAMGTHPPLKGALELTITFHLRRPKSHYRTGRNSDFIRESAPKDPLVKPDVLKLARGVEDALSGICYDDDAQIVSENLRKRYTTGLARVDVTLEPIDEANEARRVAKFQLPSDLVTKPFITLPEGSPELAYKQQRETGLDS